MIGRVQVPFRSAAENETCHGKKTMARRRVHSIGGVRPMTASIYVTVQGGESERVRERERAHGGAGRPGVESPSGVATVCVPRGRERVAGAATSRGWKRLTGRRRQGEAEGARFPPDYEHTPVKRQLPRDDPSARTLPAR